MVNKGVAQSPYCPSRKIHCRRRAPEAEHGINENRMWPAAGCNAKLYEQHCVDCHKAAGEGAPPAYPPLAGNRSLTANSPIHPIRIVLNGGFRLTTEGNPRPYGMPPFGPALNNSEVAAVVSSINSVRHIDCYGPDACLFDWLVGMVL
jgi:hypothetical protein